MPRSYSRYASTSRQRNRFRPSSSTSKLVRRNAMPFNRLRTSIPNQIYSVTAPRTMRVIMKYNDQYTLTPAANGLAADRVFRMNSIHDPDFTGTGHQPQGHDQWNFLYFRYRVDYVEVIVNLSAASAGGFVTLWGNTESTAVTDPVVAQESPYSQTVATQNAGNCPRLYRRFNPPDVLGLSRAQYNADDLCSSAFGQNPGQDCYIHLSFVDRLKLTSDQTCSVELKYYVTLFDPIQLSQS
jgi:hypothetical protein